MLPLVLLLGPAVAPLFPPEVLLLGPPEVLLLGPAVAPLLPPDVFVEGPAVALLLPPDVLVDGPPDVTATYEWVCAIVCVCANVCVCSIVALPPVVPASWVELAASKKVSSIGSQVPPNNMAGDVLFIDRYILPIG